MNEPREKNPTPEQADAIDEIARHLRELGAESETERRVKRIAPWVSSLLIHAGMIALGFVAVFAYRALDEEESVEIVGDFYQLNYEPLAEMTPDTARETPQDAQDPLEEESLTEKIDERLRDAESEALDLLPDSSASRGLADFAPRTAQGTATFAGLTGTNAQRIIFVVDASGSMIGTLQIVIDELAKSIDMLSPEQEFSVIFFQRNEALVVPPDDRLIPARPGEKVRVLRWIDEHVVPAGRSSPVEAIRKALSLQPDLIFLLSNNITGSGQFEIDRDDLLAMLDDLNPMNPETGRRRTQIQTIQFLDPDPLDTLRKIAEAHSGPKGYRFLDRQELGIGGGR